MDHRQALVLWHGDFEILRTFCFFHAHEPDKYTNDLWGPCRTSNRKFSHIIDHAVRRHGLIRGVYEHPRGGTCPYVTTCVTTPSVPDPAEGNPFESISGCDTCQDIGGWRSSSLEQRAVEHYGPSLCGRCFEYFADKRDLRKHLKQDRLCKKTTVSASEKWGNHYLAFCSNSQRPRWFPQGYEHRVAPTTMHGPVMNQGGYSMQPPAWDSNQAVQPAWGYAEPMQYDGYMTDPSAVPSSASYQPVAYQQWPSANETYQVDQYPYPPEDQAWGSTYPNNSWGNQGYGHGGPSGTNH